MNCTVCNKRSYSECCVSHKPRKPIETTKPLPRPTKNLKKFGKNATLWQQTKAQWFRKNSAYQPCHYCGVGLKPDTMTLDHKTSRSRSPELRYDLSNLVPCCFTCNGLKGSVDHDSYEHDCPDNIKETT